MSDDVNLSLHRPGNGGNRPGRVVAILLAVVIVLGALQLVFVLRRTSGGDAGRNGLPGKQLEEVALRLEKQGLAGPAARAWIDYMAAARPGRKDASRIWYRVGKMYQAHGDYERALEAYYRSEGTAGLEEIEAELSRRIAECLEGLGKFAALRLELEDRTSLAGTDSTAGEVVAEIGNWKISQADLDILIEAEIDARFSQLAGTLSPEERGAQKEKLLESLLKGGARYDLLQSLIAEELLYRKAREEKLHEEKEIRFLIRDLDRKVLAQKLLEREYASRISIGADDLKAYYDSHAGEFDEGGETKPFTDVRNEIYMKLRSQEELEVQQQLLDELRRQYDVVIYRSEPGGG